MTTTATHASSSSEAALTLPVAGLDCAVCAESLAAGLQATPGVRGATVNFAAGNARVEVDPRCSIARGSSPASRPSATPFRPRLPPRSVSASPGWTAPTARRASSEWWGRCRVSMPRV